MPCQACRKQREKALQALADQRYADALKAAGKGAAMMVGLKHKHKDRPEQTTEQPDVAS